MSNTVFSGSAITLVSRTVAAKMLDQLEAAYPEAKCGLSFASPFQLLVATVLSAQCTDERVNQVVPALWRKYRDAAGLSRAKPRELEKIIKPCGLYKAKTKSLIGAARRIVDRHGGALPGNREALEELPGVGRKTAGVILANAFGVPALAVDTHVFRLSRRMGLSRGASPLLVERDLMARWPESRWRLAHHLLIKHGRQTCRARNPACADCPVNADCPRNGLRQIAHAPGRLWAKTGTGAQ